MDTVAAEHRQTANTAAKGVLAISLFAAFLAPCRHVTRRRWTGMLERYLADLHAALAGQSPPRPVGRSAASSRDPAARLGRRLPASAMFLPDDYPKLGPRLPRALAEHVMAQVETRPASASGATRGG